MTRDSRTAFLEALQKVEPRILRRFDEAVAGMKNAADVTRLRQLVATQDVEGIMIMLRIQDSSFDEVQEAIRQAFRTGSDYQNRTAPKSVVTQLLLGFNGSHPRVEDWVQKHAGDFVSELVEDQREMLRAVIFEGTTQGRSHAEIARDLVGSREGNRRRGGFIGLHSKDVRAVRSARQQLSDLDSGYLSRAARDKRFDRAVAKAIREGRPLTQTQISKAVSAYAGRLLRKRGATIARTEGNRAMNAGRAEAIQQLVDSGQMPPEAIDVFWDATPGPHTRDSHRALNGQSVKWGDRFVSPVTGAQMLWPYDETAPAAEVVNCRCSARFRVDWLSLAR